MFGIFIWTKYSRVDQVKFVEDRQIFYRSTLEYLDSFVQHFDRKIIDTLSDTVEPYKKSENLYKQMVVFHKICCICHVNVGIILGHDGLF